MRLLLALVCVLLLLPLAALVSRWAALDADGLALWQHLASTVLPGYLGQSLLLSAAVALGVALVGGSTAAVVTLFEFPGRRWLSWALLLPMAMPAYVLAYAWTDTLQYSGPLQTALRAAFGWQGALWPDIRSLGGAVPLFVLCLYPYAYLLVRAALAERCVPLMEAARLLGAGWWRRVTQVALPMARPALAAGVALALMETLADYGVGAYFGLSTFTTGIFRAWLSMGDRDAAAQLATVLLVLVALLVWMEQRAQARLRFAAARQGALHGGDARPLALGWRGCAAAWAVCLLPVLLGFVLPVLALLRLASTEGDADAPGLDLSRFAGWAVNSFVLAAAAACLAVLLAMALAAARRRQPGRWLDALARGVGLGYAVPGAVIVIGLLWPLGAWQARWPEWPLAGWLTAGVAGLLYAYLVRFSAVAMQSVDAGYARLPTSFDESARLLGHGPWATWRRVHWPLLRGAAGTAWLLVFVDVMKELPATLVLRPFNHDTLAVVANQLARDERLGEAAWPSLAIVAVGLLPVLLLGRGRGATGC
ncbi:iron ABC transporter permease [Ideonella sp. 4Y16]|uniref:Iron ABC transporter permease n=1 Tax=Ideonella alba TaxID=2824118 RepID=A0A941BHI2_9BURK|nr:iron ABC transporter permease [Ideonella alba]MBQ0931638.1 iron ABC transporter permease [Ideonella alba]MBQ0944072.1 iron ABC transporter permease [Ideonella alba]